ncbi:ArdC-like ssDNA-binding domain-containing protein [Helicobacter sp.]|uniref:ArdC-like ssDNA-binding domain-containing protein n=1 Tax=Helicobacter sp. TaxID=218 RepID=UPI0019CAEF92|nr:ArdC-like ssDNA-binding domain-containing protein [Helicobacter sp.]MBD5165630.1 DUF1738 domain-containing protein [Helicobacter sp.]
MARKADKLENQEVATQVAEQSNYVAWEQKSNVERMESFNGYVKSILLHSIKEKKQVWSKEQSAKDLDNSIPYNASTGYTFSGVESLLLRTQAELKGYKEPQFITMQQGNFMGGKLKRALDENGNPALTKNGKDAYEQGIKVAFLQRYDYVPKLDNEGKEMTRIARDKEGNPKLDKEGKEITEIVKEKVFLKEPRLETITLYHPSQFEGLDTSKLKERNLEPLQEFRAKQKENNYDLRPKNLDNLGLDKETTNHLKNFLTAEMKGIDYVPIQEQSINKLQTQVKGQQQKQEMGRSL